MLYEFQFSKLCLRHKYAVNAAETWLPLSAGSAFPQTCSETSLAEGSPEKGFFRDKACLSTLGAFSWTWE